MRYLYFPGCTLKTTGAQYDSSAKAVMRQLGCALVELEGWNCCGATASDMISALLSVSLAARNIALAERDEGDLVTACSSCFLNLFRVQSYLKRDPQLQDKLDVVMASIGLRYSGRTRVRHLLEVIATDLGSRAITEHVVRPLNGLKVVPYYGCMVVRPYAEFDGPDLPVSMDGLIAALGAEVVPYIAKTRCCGGALIGSKKEIALTLIGELLIQAGNADCIVTVCPMCQLNLDAYQGEAARYVRRRFDIPVLYLTQLMGLAFDLPESDLKLSQNIVSADRLLAKIDRPAVAVHA